MAVTWAPSDEGRDDYGEHAAAQLAADRLQAAIAALESAAAVSGGGRRTVYTAWSRHLQDDWRGLLLLAARGESS